MAFLPLPPPRIRYCGDPVSDLDWLSVIDNRFDSTLLYVVFCINIQPIKFCV